MDAAAPQPAMSAKEAGDLFARLAGNIGKVMRGSDGSVRKLLAAFASGGHVLIEDYPGTGKTTLAKSLAASIGARFTRVQFNWIRSMPTYTGYGYAPFDIFGTRFQIEF